MVEHLIKDPILQKAATALIAVVVLFILKLSGKYAIKKILHLKTKNNQEINPQIPTLITIFNSLLNYFLVFVFIAVTLNLLGLSTAATSLMATAGIGALAIGMGAQGFISDIVNGFTILLENYYSVGETIAIDTQQGVVVSLTLRTTSIKSTKGELFIIPNGHINAVTNFSRDIPVVFSEFNITDPNRIDCALAACERACAAEYNNSCDILCEMPYVSGAVSITPYGVTIRIKSKIKSYDDVIVINRQILKAVIGEFKKENIDFFFLENKQYGETDEATSRQNTNNASDDEMKQEIDILKKQ